MKIFLVISFLISLGYNEVALASEHHDADVIVLNENSFVRSIKRVRNWRLFSFLKLKETRSILSMQYW